jgi:senataxin
MSSIRCPKLNESQEEAARLFLNGPEHNLCLTQGPPGTGKTTFLTAVLLRTLFKGLQDDKNDSCTFDFSKRCLVTAPTNKAVSVIATRFLSAIGDFQQINCILIGVEDALFPRDENDSNVEEWQSLKNIYLYTWCNKLIEDTKFLDSIDTSSLEQIVSAIQFLNNLTSRLKRSIPRAAKKYNLFNTVKCLKIQLLSLKNDVNTSFDRTNVINLFSGLKELESSDAVYSELLDTSNIIFSTLTSSSVGIMKNTLNIDELFVDEAAAATEAEVVIPLHLHPKRMLVVGDPKQLPASIQSRRAATFGLDKSVLDRLMYARGEDHVMLDTQYRMNPAICSFPSHQFYDGNLIDGENVRASSYKSKIQLLSGRPYIFLDIPGDEHRSYHGSYYNDEEANVVVALVQQYSIMAQSEFNSERIRIITFYSGQCKAINYKLRRAGLGGIVCSTVDSSQGSESDIVIVSFVRCGLRTGFLHDDRRINVSLTRAKYQLICIGNSDTLQRSGGSLEKFIVDAKSRGLLKKLGNHNKRRIDYNDSIKQDFEATKKKRI